MIITSFKELMHHRVFKILAQAQALIDDEDNILSQSKITRSPYHLLALLLMHLMLEKESQYQAVDNLNAIIQEAASKSSIPMRLEHLQNIDLTYLEAVIDWKSLANELNTQPGYFKMSLPQILIQNLQKTIPIGIFNLFTSVITPSRTKIITITSSMHQEFTWFQSVDLENVPQSIYTLSPAFKKTLDGMKTELFAKPALNPLQKDIGMFRIIATMEERMSDSAIPDSYKVSIKNPTAAKESKEFTEPTFRAQLEKNTIGQGLYRAFKGLTYAGDFCPSEIRVEFSGKSFLNQSEIGVVKKQDLPEDNFVHGLTFTKYVAFSIEVNAVFACSESLIGVDYSDKSYAKESTKTKRPDSVLEIFIVLSGFKRRLEDTISEEDRMQLQLIARQLDNGRTISNEFKEFWQKHMQRMQEVVLFPSSLSHCAVINAAPLLLKQVVEVSNESKLEEKSVQGLESRRSTSLTSLSFLNTTPLVPKATTPSTNNKKPTKQPIECAPCCSMM